MQACDQLLDFFCRLLRALGEAAHFICHHSESAPGFTGTRRFDGGVEGQQVGLLRNGLDHVEHAADLVAFALEFVHGFGGVAHFRSQALDLGDGLVDHAITFTSLLVSGNGGLGRFLGVARHFLHGSGHLVHRGGDLVGLHFLRIHPGAGLLGDRRQLFGGAGNLRHAVADAADQLAQADGHTLDAALQHAQLVLAADGQVAAEVTGGNAFDHFKGFAQRRGDLPGDDPGGDHAEDQCQQGRDDDHLHRPGAFFIAALVLCVDHDAAGFQHLHAQCGHFFQC